jgi:uncharacterized membrane protein
MNKNEPLVSGLKRRARESIRAALSSAIAVSVAWFVLSSVLSFLSQRASGYDKMYGAIEEEFRRVYELGAGKMPDAAFYAATFKEHFKPFGSLLSAALGLCQIAAGAGFTWCCLALARGEKTSWRSVFDGFGHFFKLLWLRILIGVFVWLWTVLLIFPGVIAAFRYSMAIYVMRDHPEYGALRCIRESKALMRGRKADLFVLGISFFPWFILSAVIFRFSGFDFLALWLSLYSGVSFAGFYIAVSRGKVVDS